MPELLEIHLPSAFTLCRYLEDYELAREVSELCPAAFDTPGLRGWLAAVQGITNPDSAAESFARAAEAFAEDRFPKEQGGRGLRWDDMNVRTWSPHFRVRSLLSSAVRDPERVRELVIEAAEIADPEAGGRSAPVVRQTAILVRALATLLGPDPGVDVGKVRKDFQDVMALSRQDGGGEVATRALALAAEAFEGFRVEPTREITRTRLREALDALRRVPFVERGLPGAIESVLGERAMTLAVNGPTTWMHRTLEGITDESQLRRIILRLSQASLPVYAQILHGPQEYGKDVAVYFEHNGKRVLRMYQAKAGNISLPDWRQARSQLEDMFLVRLQEFLVEPGPGLVREGVLVCNGHALPTAAPVMQGWIDQMRKVHGWPFEFMHLDSIVQWVVKHRLPGELRRVFAELGVPIVGDGHQSQRKGASTGESGER
jgi:hypothetical protein